MEVVDEIQISSMLVVVNCNPQSTIIGDDGVLFDELITANGVSDCCLLSSYHYSINKNLKSISILITEQTFERKLEREQTEFSFFGLDECWRFPSKENVCP